MKEDDWLWLIGDDLTYSSLILLTYLSTFGMSNMFLCVFLFYLFFLLKGCFVQLWCSEDLAQRYTLQCIWINTCLTNVFNQRV